MWCLLYNYVCALWYTFSKILKIQEERYNTSKELVNEKYNELYNKERKLEKLEQGSVEYENLVNDLNNVKKQYFDFVELYNIEAEKMNIEPIRLDKPQKIN